MKNLLQYWLSTKIQENRYRNARLSSKITTIKIDKKKSNPVIPTKNLRNNTKKEIIPLPATTTVQYTVNANKEETDRYIFEYGCIFT
jgi:hypothetical protein